MRFPKMDLILHSTNLSEKYNALIVSKQANRTRFAFPLSPVCMFVPSILRYQIVCYSIYLHHDSINYRPFRIISVHEHQLSTHEFPRIASKTHSFDIFWPKHTSLNNGIGRFNSIEKSFEILSRQLARMPYRNAQFSSFNFI